MIASCPTPAENDPDEPPALGKSLIALKVVLIPVVALKDLADASAIPFFGGAVATPFIWAAAAIELAIITVETLIDEYDGRQSDCIINTAAAIQGAVREAYDLLEDTKKVADDTFDLLGETKEVVDEVEAFVQFLACPFTEIQQQNTVFLRQGCDGIDNNCNSFISSDGAQKLVVSTYHFLIQTFPSRNSHLYFSIWNT